MPHSSALSRTRPKEHSAIWADARIPPHPTHQWSNIPDELLAKIFESYPLKAYPSAPVLRLVCRQWSAIISRNLTSLRPRRIVRGFVIANAFPDVHSLTLTDEAYWRTKLQGDRSNAPYVEVDQTYIECVRSYPLVGCPFSFHWVYHAVNSLVQCEIRRCCITVDEVLWGAQYISKLRHLNLSRNAQVTDEGVGYLRTCSRLESLNLENCAQVTDRALFFLATSTSLQAVNFRGCDVTRWGVRALSSMVALKRLNLSQCPRFPPSALSALAPLSNLEDLAIDAMRVGLSNREESALGLLTSLKSLSARFSRFSDHSISHLSHCTKLTMLDLSGNMQCTSRAMSALSSLTQLQILRLDRCRITRLSPLTNFVGLVQLNLRKCDLLESKEFITLTALKCLYHLNTQDCKLEKEAFLAMSHMAQLTHWNAANCYRQGDSAHFVLGAFAKARFLNFSRLPARRVNLKNLRLSKELIHLNLAESLVVEEDLEHLRKLDKLVHLNIARSQYIGDRAFEVLFTLTALEHLNLTGSKCSHVGLSKMTALTSLTSLSLSHCLHVECSAMQFLKPLTSLRALQLRQTGVQSKGIQQLYPLVHLTQLDLNRCRVTNEIFHTLRMLSRLRQLDLRGCRLHKGLIEGLSTALPTLKQVYA